MAFERVAVFDGDFIDRIPTLDETKGDLSCDENWGADGVGGCIGSDDFLAVIVNYILPIPPPIINPIPQIPQIPPFRYG